ncbi:hypothetical protein HCBAA847_1659 [Helicobacter cinaedi CCUG 18818 = ATCC BAA-847]|uniref:Uncharacterized protein n=1 Tax=Helicobacter cinaedi CCUG 18818 = ATCC BAA-847 TaxID=537971 RepID=A0AAI8MNJ1_9HELI|nr:hypothetical protein [Helicobacter cinaedi]EFR45509.1 hypothetical protein HCCG_00055 [Helicobacter cinaedi CCUG 18818 = ATCC BAA-847]BAM32889.1 hypothetical protein HCBAA847_1659 [Helicobacter cinaedi CCUG 18818 = ATCC BAA-847]
MDSIREHAKASSQDWSAEDFDSAIQDGLGFLWRGEYESFCIEHADSEILKKAFKEAKACILRGKSGFVKSFLGGKDVSEMAIFANRLFFSNQPFVDGVFITPYNGCVDVAEIRYEGKVAGNYPKLKAAMELAHEIIVTTANAAYAWGMKNLKEELCESL